MSERCAVLEHRPHAQSCAGLCTAVSPSPAWTLSLSRDRPRHGACTVEDMQAISLFHLAALAPFLFAMGCGDSGPTQPSSSPVVGFDAAPLDRADPSPVPSARDASSEEAAVGSSPVSAEVSGAYGGAPFVGKAGAVSRFYLEDPSGDAGNLVAAVSVLVTPYESACTAVRDTTRPVLSFYLRSGHGELAPETFSIVDSFVAGGEGPAPQGTANIFGLDAADCGVHNLDQATSGGVTITSAASGRIEATFSVTFKTSGTFSGRFSLATCPGTVPLDDSDPTVKCVL